MTLRAIGVGLGRTGTLSLKAALEKLGFGPCYHMIELRAAEDAIQRWSACLEGRASWDQVFEGFAATTDHPGCEYWRELAAFYPDAKMILTVRDADGWFDSVNSTILSDDFYRTLERAPAVVRACFRKFRDFEFCERHHNDRAAMTDYFRRHNQSIVDTIDPDRLLVFEVRQGWEPLCGFLGVPVPDTPFPKVNERAMLEEEFKRGAQGEIEPDEQRRQLRELILTLRNL